VAVNDDDNDGAAAEDGPLPPNWQEVAAPDGDGVYYWNEVTDVTSWERPKSLAPAQSELSTNHGSRGCSSGSSSSSSGEAGMPPDGPGSGAGAGGAEEVLLPAGWMKVFHAATGQVMYEHAESKEQRCTAPTAADDKSDIKPMQALSE